MVSKKKRIALIGLIFIFILPLALRASQDVTSGTDSVNVVLDSGEPDEIEIKGSLAERIAEWLYERNLDPRLVAFILSMLPISELRGAVIIGIPTYNGPWWHISLICLLGNLVPVIPILFLLDLIMKLLGRIPFFKRFFDWLIARAKRKGGLIERYEYIGVFLFVAIPLPFTGAWTGSLIASVLRMNPWRSFLTVCIGVFTADVIMTSFVLLGWWGLLAATVVLPVLWILSKWLEKKGRDKEKRSRQTVTTRSKG